MKSIVGVLVVAVALTGLYFLNDATRDEDGKSRLHVAKAVAVSVKVERPSRRSIVHSVQAPGSVEAFSEVDISAEVVGKILEMPVEEGDVVKAGDLLCRLDDAVHRTRIKSATANIAKLEAAIEQAEASFEKAKRDYSRQRRLSEKDATSMSEFEDYKTAYIREKAGVLIRRQELIEAQAMLQSAEEDLAKTIIQSPIDGVVSQRFAKEGEVVVMGTMNNQGTRIMVISDLSRMQVRCRIDEGDATLVKPEQTARIFLQSDTQRSISGYVLRVGIKGTKPQGRDVVTFETLIIVDSYDPRVKPGMTATVEIEVDRSEDALVIPVQAVVHRKRRDLPEKLIEEYDRSLEVDSHALASSSAEYLKIVFSVEDEVATPHLVKTGIADAKDVEVLSGLTLEQNVVVGPFRSLDQLAEGTKVKIEDEKVKEKAPGSGRGGAEAKVNIAVAGG